MSEATLQEEPAPLPPLRLKGYCLGIPKTVGVETTADAVRLIRESFRLNSWKVVTVETSSGETVMDAATVSRLREAVVVNDRLVLKI